MYLKEKKNFEAEVEDHFHKKKNTEKAPQKLTVKCVSLNMTDKSLCF